MYGICLIQVRCSFYFLQLSEFQELQSVFLNIGKKIKMEILRTEIKNRPSHFDMAIFIQWKRKHGESKTKMLRLKIY